MDIDVQHEDTPITITPKHYLELEDIEPDRLVYLSPNSPNTLRQFSHDDVYIIGG